MEIPLLKPDIPVPAEFLHYYENSMKANHYSNGGPCAIKLEESFSERIGGHCRLVNNATMGLTILLSSLGLAPGSRVGVSSFTFSATIQSVLEAGLVPVIFDCDDSMVMDQVDDEDLAAVVITHPFGIVPRNYRELWNFYDSRGIRVVHDAAASLGNEDKLLADCLEYTNGIVYSLHATKTFGVGEGGLIQVRDTRQANVIEIARNFGMVDGVVVRQGFNGKMPELMAAVGLARLSTFDGLIANKLEVASKFKNLVYAPHTVPHLDPHPYQVMLYTTTRQAELASALAVNRVGCRIYYVPLHLSEYLSKYRGQDQYPNSDKFHQGLICLPFYSSMSEEEMLAINKVLNSL